MSKEDTYENAVAEIPVTFEGTWSRRGYSANHCTSLVIQAASGKVLDFEVISEVCNQCNQKKVSCSQEEFEEWLQTHDCQGSYGGSSSSMEIECAKQLWRRSAQYCLMYKWMISDGNPKPYSSIWNIYEACDTCNRFEALEVTSKEYISWKASDEYKEQEEKHLQGTINCNRVIKLDCIGHVQKRLGKAVYDFQVYPKTGIRQTSFFYLEYQTQLLSIPFFLTVIFCHLNPYTVTLAVEHVTFFMITSMQYIYNTFFILFVLKLFYISMYVF